MAVTSNGQGSSEASAWTPSSHRARPAAQKINYPPERHAEYDDVLKKISRLPGLVTPIEIERLREHLADVANNKAFLLQGGDCAETFADCSQGPIESRLSLILLMSLVLIYGARTPIVRIARIAGQYAKPRSSDTETLPDGRVVPSFRGDNINGHGVDNRTPDPARLLEAYFHSVATLNCIRSLLASGFADLNHPRTWSLSHVRDPKLLASFEGIVERLEDSLDFMRTIGAEGRSSSVRTIELFTSHEGLMLDFEQAMTRMLPSTSSPTSKTQNYPYDLSAHFIWIGDRTRQLDGAHVEFFRGIRNPIGVKVGASMKADELQRLLGILDPAREPGRLTLICRYGAAKVADCLPAHIQAVQATQHPVIWVCDPCHGNTHAVGAVKTRHMADIVSEIASSFEIHAKLGSRLGGVHLELTGDVDPVTGQSVTEVLGGSMELDPPQLGVRYESLCDPRINVEQALDLAFMLQSSLTAERRGRGHDPSIATGLRSRSSSANNLRAP